MSLPGAAEVLRQGVWSAAEVASLMDADLVFVERWCRAGLLPGATHRAATGWSIPGRALFLFLARRVEPHYSAETVAGLLDASVETVRGWIKAERLPVMKTGTAKSAMVRIPESALIAWMKAGG